jgi:hypothetical protein
VTSIAKCHAVEVTNRMKSRQLACAIVLAGNAWISAAAQEAPAGPAPSGAKYALLIGCTAYPELPRRYQLRGPSNDVALTAELLRNDFTFDEARIVTLVHENDATHRPTYDNIAREFAALAHRVGPGDQVFILLGGHGSQVKDDNPSDPTDDEPDGLDEVFLPEDVTARNPSAAGVRAIRDDQIGRWLDAIRARGAFVFYIADTCHSGSGTRGDEDTFYRTREVPAEILDPTVIVPDEAEKGVPEIRTDVDGMGGIVAIYAVDEKNAELEHPMPPESKRDGLYYGRLTYALNYVLSHSRRPLMYYELAQQIRWQYDGWDWRDLGYTHGREKDLKRKVLGQETWERRSIVTFARDEYDRLSINVGLLHGAYVGNIYTVYPPAGAANDDVAAGYVVVTEATATSARVEPCEHDGAPPVTVDALPAHGRCELAVAALSSLKVAVGVAPAPEQPEIDCSKAEAAIRELAADPAALIRVATGDEIPAILVLVSQEGLFLRRTFEAVDFAAEDAADAARFGEKSFGPFSLESGPETKFALALQAMAKAMNIRSLATTSTGTLAGDPIDQVVSLKLDVERWIPEEQEFQAIDLTELTEVTAGDKIRVSVSNIGEEPVDVTILYIDNAFQITSYYPTKAQELRGGFDNRLAPGDAPAFYVFTLNDRTLGLEDVLVIATLSVPGASPENFVYLEQEGVPSGVRGGGAVVSPAARVFGLLGYGVGDRGGEAAEDLATFAVRRVSWTVKKQDPETP